MLINTVIYGILYLHQLIHPLLPLLLVSLLLREKAIQRTIIKEKFLNKIKSKSNNNKECLNIFKTHNDNNVYF